MEPRILLAGLMLLFISCESTLEREFNHAMSGNDLRAAAERVERALAVNPQDPEANFLMGRILAEQRQYPDAMRYFDRSLAAAPAYSDKIDHILETHYRNEFNNATTAWDHGGYEATITHFEAAIQIYPDRWEKYPIKGEAHKNLGQYESAQQSFTKCLSVPRMRRFCGTNLAISYFKNNQFEQAKRVAEQYLDHYPADRNLLKIAAYAYLETGGIEDAGSYFSRYVDAGFTYDALRQFATELNNKGEIFAAERFFTLCLRVNPSDPEVLAALSSIYLETGNYDLMVQANERLHSLEPDSPKHMMRLMLAYELAGEIEKFRSIQSELGINE